MSRQTWFDEIDNVYDDQDDFTADIDLVDNVSVPSRRGTKPSKRKHTKGKGANRSHFPVDDEFDPAAEFDDGDADAEIAEALERKAREKRRAEISEPFKCRNCRAFIGEPPSGGRQRNHCPLCLYSLHVDDKTPGDRASECRSLMTPIGVFYRPNLEQMVVHECRGCGFVRYNRIAADDNPILLSELPIVDQASIARGEREEE